MDVRQIISNVLDLSVELENRQISTDRAEIDELVKLSTQRKPGREPYEEIKQRAADLIMEICELNALIDQYHQTVRCAVTGLPMEALKHIPHVAGGA